MIYSYLFLVVYIVYISVGFIVLYKNPKQSENILFFTSMILFSIWAMVNSALFNVTDSDIASIIRSNTVFSWGIVYSVILHFVLVTSGAIKIFTRKVNIWIIRAVIYIPAIINIIIYKSDYYSSSEIYMSSIGWLVSTSIERSYFWQNYFFFYYSGSMIVSIIILLIWRLNTKITRMKKQSTLLIIGFTLAFILGSIFDVILPLQGYQLIYGSTLIVVFIPLLIMLYAVNKYGFLHFSLTSIISDLMKLSNEGVIITDLSGYVREVNDGALDMLKLSTISDIRLVKQIGLDIEDVAEVESKRTSLKKNDGTRLSCLVSQKILFDKLGEQYAYLFILNDIHELEKAENELKIYAETLEQKVSERTLAIQQTNEKLSLEIEERIKSENRIKYIAFHDYLTGMFNRRYYETQLDEMDQEKNLPLTIAIGDINGLKLINDAFGHESGDKLLVEAAKVIDNNNVKNGITARIGGDEFLMLLPNTSEAEAELVLKKISDISKSTIVESIELSISFGFATKNDVSKDINEVYRVAEDAMYRKKLSEIPSMRSGAIKTILNTLYEKDKNSESHSRRVSEISKNLAEKLNLSEQEISMAKTSGLLHDIGKIIIPINIINKVGTLTETEMRVIRNHTEIGFRILNSISEMREMSTIVLNHHEKWDGTGYPRKIKKNDIPLISRIIAIADSYDAMTNHRSYRTILSHEEAIEEIKRCSGTQFDPELTKIFIEYSTDIISIN